MDLATVSSAPASCLPDDCFCERVAEAWLKQPTNTWSSFAFVVVGFGLLMWPRRSLPPWLRLTYATCVIGVGIASAIFHARLSFVGQWLDVSSMYAYATLLSCVNLSVLRTFGSRAAAAAFVGVTALTALLAAVAPASRRVVFDVLLCVALLSMLRLAFTAWRGVSKRPLLGAIVAFVAATGAWVLDMRHVWCTPNSAFSGHALWHILGAVATACVFAYYQSGFAAEAAGGITRHMGYE